MIQKINNDYLCKSSQQGVQYIMQLLCLDRLFDNRLHILANLSSLKEIHSDQHLDAFSSHSLDYQKHLSQYSLLGTMSYLAEMEIIFSNSMKMVTKVLELQWTEQNPMSNPGLKGINSQLKGSSFMSTKLQLIFWFLLIPQSFPTCSVLLLLDYQ